MTLSGTLPGLILLELPPGPASRMPPHMIRLWAVAQQGAQAHHGGSRSQLHSLELDHFNQVVDMCHAKHEWSQENCLHVAAALHYRYTSIRLPLLH